MSHDHDFAVRPMMDSDLDRALSRLGSVDLDPIAQRIVHVAAERRLAERHRNPSRVERYEPALLVALSAAHLLWLVLRLIAF